MKEIYKLAEEVSVQDIGETSSASSESQVEEVLSSISDQQCSDWSELEIESLIEPYNSALLEWVSESSQNVEFVEEAVNSGVVDVDNFDLYAMIQAGQYQQYKQVAQEVFEWLEQELEEREEEEDV